MANALNRNLKVGNKVVLEGNVVAVISAQLFGCDNFTSGTAIGVSINGTEYRADGYDIVPDETMKRFAKENGWLDENGNVIPAT